MVISMDPCLFFSKAEGYLVFFLKKGLCSLAALELPSTDCVIQKIYLVSASHCTPLQTENTNARMWN